MRTTKKYIFFWNGIYSNWYPANFTLDGVKFKGVEQYMMYQKALLFGDEEIAAQIMMADNPEQQKALGRQIRGFDKSVWDKACLSIVYDGNYAKFTQNEDLKKELLASGDKIICESSPVDSIWGCGLHSDDPLINNPTNWKGLNLLGNALMLVRNEIKYGNL